MFKVNNRSTRHCSGVIIVNFECYSSVFFADFNHVICRWNIYCLSNINLSMCFRVRSRRLVTFKMSLYVTTVNNSFKLLPISCHKELHLRCCIGLELNNVVNMIQKNSTRYWGAPHDQVQPWENMKNSLS